MIPTCRQRQTKLLELLGLKHSNILSAQLSEVWHSARLWTYSFQNPDLILMDEPFSALDCCAVVSANAFKLISTTEKSVIFVTHDVEEALLLGSVF
ncbi:MAG: hypothetical protein ACLRXQ_08455 [Phascolarctobacterium faecium]